MILDRLRRLLPGSVQADVAARLGLDGGSGLEAAVRAVGYADAREAMLDVVIAESSEEGLAEKLAADREARSLFRSRGFLVEGVNFVSAEERAEAQSLYLAHHTAMERGDFEEAEEIDAKLTALLDGLEGRAFHQEETGDETDLSSDPERSYLLTWVSGIEPYEAGLRDWGGHQNARYPVTTRFFSDAEEWFIAMRTQLERWFQDPGLSLRPELHSTPTEEDLVGIGHDLWARETALLARRKASQARVLKERVLPWSDPDVEVVADLERARFARHAALLRLAKLPEWALHSIGWTRSLSPAERRKRIEHAPPGLVPVRLQLSAPKKRRSRDEVSREFYEALERISGEKQVFYLGPFVMIGDQKGGVLGNLELHVSSAVGPRNEVGIHLAFIGVPIEDRSRGNGRKLISRVLQAADEVGVPVDLHVDPQTMRGEKKPPLNKVQLRAFYRSMGFIPVQPRQPDELWRPVPAAAK